MLWRATTLYELGSDTHRLPAGAGRVVALVPGEDVTLVGFEAPPRVNRRTLERIAQYSVADTLAESIEDVHVVPLVRDKARALALVVRRARLDHWLAELTAQKIRPVAVLPDYLALPGDDEAWCVRLTGGRAVVRTGSLDGFAAEPDLAAEILDHRIATGHTPRRCHVLVAEEEPEDARYEPVLSSLRSAGCQLDMTTCRRESHDDLYRPMLAANLLKGRYDPLHESLEELSKWRGAAAAAVIFAVTYVASVYVDNLNKERALAQLNTEIEQIYREAFDRDGPIIDVRLQANRALQRMQGDFASSMARAGFMDLLHAARGSLVSDDWQVKALRFRDGRLILDVSAVNFRELTRLKTQLEDAALEVDEQRAVSSGAAVEAVLALRKVETDGPT